MIEIQIINRSARGIKQMIMKKLDLKKLLVGLAIMSMMCVTCVIAVSSCKGGSPARGIQTNEPADVVAELFKRYTENGDYLSLCSASIGYATLLPLLEAYKQSGGYYLTADAANSATLERIRNNATDAANHREKIQYKIIMGKEIWSVSGEGSITVGHDPKAGTYYIADVSYKK
jgi:hypothetical protein